VRLVLIGDGESPHLLKWARALSKEVDLWVASTRGFAPEFNFLVPAKQMLALQTSPDHAGGNIALMKKLPQLGAWLAKAQPDWLHAHYLTSAGTLAWISRRGWGLKCRIAGSAWGSDILVTPDQGWAYRWLTKKVLSECDVLTSDSQHMAARMRELGAKDVMVFPFGLESVPRQGAKKDPWLFFANRGLEPIYRPHLVIEAFAAVAAVRPEARLVVANDGSLRGALVEQAKSLGLEKRVSFMGRLGAATMASQYARARWFMSLPESDSVAVSVLEALSHECVPILSELPANRELIGEGAAHGILLPAPSQLPVMLDGIEAESAGRANRTWVIEHGLFQPAVQRFLARLREFA
jgi:glycosyltransferase involved in cell wall biosynthesis